MATHHSKRLLDLMGKLEWDATFDYKAERTRRGVEQSSEARQRKTVKRSKTEILTGTRNPRCLLLVVCLRRRALSGISRDDGDVAEWLKAAVC